MSSGDTCPLCGELADRIVAQTGYGDYLPDAAYKLKKEELSFSCDVRRCPECDGIFIWEDHPQYYGSGNLDEEWLIRLDDTKAALVRSLLDLPEDAASVRNLVTLAFQLLEQDWIREILSRICYRNTERFPDALPAIVDRFLTTDDFSLSGVISNYCYVRPQKKAEVLAEIERNPKQKEIRAQALIKKLSE